MEIGHIEFGRIDTHKAIMRDVDSRGPSKYRRTYDERTDKQKDLSSASMERSLNYINDSLFFGT